MCLDQGLERGRRSQATDEVDAEHQFTADAESLSKKWELQDALFDSGVADELVEFHAEGERRIFSPRGGRAASAAPLDARLRETAVRFMWSLCQEAVRLLPAAGFQAATLFDIACLRYDGGMPAERVPVVCTVIVKLLKKTDSSTTFVSNAAMVPHAQRMVEYLRRLGYNVPDATEEALRTLEAELLVTLKWDTEPFTIESWLSVFVSRFNIITSGIHAARLSQVWEQAMLCARALVMKRPASRETPPLALARGLLGVSFVCVGLLPMEAADTAASMGSLRKAVMASPEEMQAACAVAAAALQQEASPPLPRRPDGPGADNTGESRALLNYEQFHNLPKGTATVEQVTNSSAGIAGWVAMQGGA